MSQLKQSELLKATCIEMGGDFFVGYDGFVEILNKAGLRYKKRTLYNQVNKNPERWPESRMLGRQRYFSVAKVHDWVLGLIEHGGDDGSDTACNNEQLLGKEISAANGQSAASLKGARKERFDE